MMKAIYRYTSSVLYDVVDDVSKILWTLNGRFSEHLEIQHCLAYVACRCDADFPWLFYPELSKALRSWCASHGVPNFSLAITEVDNRTCYINGYILLPIDTVSDVLG